MKHLQKFLCLLALIFMISTLALPGAAITKSVNATLCKTTLQPNETITITISIDEVYASSLGISINCDPALEIIDGKWIKDGLIASFDTIKNKGVYTNGTASLVSEDIFSVKLKAKNIIKDDLAVSVTVKAKNGTATVLEDTVTKYLNIKCQDHDFDNYHMTETSHYRTCKTCGYTESESHDQDNGTIHKIATCQNEGEIIYTCQVCDKTSTETIPALPHNYEEATCEKAEICFDCGTILKQALGHRDNDKNGFCDDCTNPLIQMGDINKDGIVDMKDAALLQRHVLKIDIILDNSILNSADVTKDGIVDMKDAAKLTRYVIKVIDSLN